MGTSVISQWFFSKAPRSLYGKEEKKMREVHCWERRPLSFLCGGSCQVWERLPSGQGGEPHLPNQRSSKSDALYCCWRSCSDFHLPLQGETSVSWGLRGSCALWDCTVHRSGVGLCMLRSSASVEWCSHVSGMALRILMFLKTIRSHCFAGLILIMGHFPDLISFCRRAIPAGVQRLGCGSPGFAPKLIVWPRASPSAQWVLVSSSVKVAVLGSREPGTVCH